MIIFFFLILQKPMLKQAKSCISLTLNHITDTSACWNQARCYAEVRYQL